MKNKFLITSLLTLLLSIGTFFGPTSKANAEMLHGGQLSYTVDLYATDYLGDLYLDPSTPSGYAYNSIDLIVSEIPLVHKSITLPLITDNEYNWSIDTIPWSLKMLSGAECLTYNGYSEGSLISPTSYSTMMLSYLVQSAGTVVMHVTSPGAASDGSDSTSYTVTINIVDNTPKPTSSH